MNRSNVHLCTCCNMYGEIALISYGCLGIVHAWLVTDTISPALNTSITIGYRLHKIRPCPTFSLFSQPFILHPETIRLDPAQRFLLFSPFTVFIQKKLDETLHNLFFTPPFLSSTRKKKVRDCTILLLFPHPFLSPLRKRDIQQIFLTATGDCNSARCKCDISSEKHIARALFVQVL